MTIHKLKDSQRGLIEPGFGLGPFAFKNRLVLSLYREFPYSRFAQVLREQFPHLPKRALPGRTVKAIYERCVEAKAQRDIHEVARAIARPPGWKKSRNKLGQLINLLDTYKQSDLEQRIRAAQSNFKRTRIQPLVRQLLPLLRGMDTIAEWWEGFAGFARWLDFYRGYVWTLDSRLRGQLTQSQRAEVIVAAFEHFKVRKTSEDGIKKALQREAQELRRFVFNGSLEIQETQYTVTGPVGRHLDRPSKRKKRTRSKPDPGQS